LEEERQAKRDEEFVRKLRTCMRNFFFGMVCFKIVWLSNVLILSVTG
jgi:hypothetical protein